MDGLWSATVEPRVFQWLTAWSVGLRVCVACDSRVRALHVPSREMAAASLLCAGRKGEWRLLLQARWAPRALCRARVTHAGGPEPSAICRTGFAKILESFVDSLLRCFSDADDTVFQWALLARETDNGSFRPS